MSTIKTVAVAGASGAVGEPLVQELLNANFTVTALTRANSTSTFPSSVKVANVDYNDVESLTSALKGHDALVSTMSSASIDQQHKLVDAAMAAGVKRLIPSEFGCDISKPETRQLPVFAQKVQIEEDIERKTRGTQTTYTFIFNNVFLDWSLDKKFGIDLQEKKMEILDGGETVYTTTPIPFVAKGVVGVLQHPDETANKSVRLHGTNLTQKKFLEIAQRVVGKDGWQITEANTADLEKQSYEILKQDPGNIYGWIPGFLKRAIFAEGYGGSFSQNNDNEMLGLKELSESEVEDIVRSWA